MFYVVKGSEAAIKKCLSTEELQSQEVMEGMRLGDKLASQGLRILAIAFKVMRRIQYEEQKIRFESATTPEEIESTRFDRSMQWAGLVCNSDPLCPSVPRAVEQLEQFASCRQCAQESRGRLLGNDDCQVIERVESTLPGRTRSHVYCERLKIGQF